MRKFILLIFAILTLNNLYVKSQTPFKDSAYDKKVRINLLKVKVYDISGNITKGLLYYASDSTLFVSNWAKDTLYVFSIEDIQRLAVSTGPSYWSIVGTTFGIMQGINLAVGLTGTKDYFPGNLIIGQVIVIPVTLISMVVASAVTDKYNYEINSDTAEYNNVYPFIKSKNPFAVNLYQNIEPEPKIKNQEKIDEFKTPLLYKNPESFSIFHFSVNFSYINTYNIKNQTIKWTNITGFSKITNDFINTKRFQYLSGIRFLKNYQIEYSYQNEKISNIYAEFTSSNPNVTTARAEIFTALSLHSISLRYIYNPVNRKLEHRNEFSAAATCLLSKFWLNAVILCDPYIYNENDNYQLTETYIKPGLRLSVDYDYYFVKSISFKAGISGDLFTPVEVKEFGYYFADNTKLTLCDYDLYLNSLSFYFGINLHL